MREGNRGNATIARDFSQVYCGQYWLAKTKGFFFPRTAPLPVSYYFSPPLSVVASKLIYLVYKKGFATCMLSTIFTGSAEWFEHYRTLSTESDCVYFFSVGAHSFSLFLFLFLSLPIFRTVACIERRHVLSSSLIWWLEKKTRCMHMATVYR